MLGVSYIYLYILFMNAFLCLNTKFKLFVNKFHEFKNFLNLFFFWINLLLASFYNWNESVSFYFSKFSREIHWMHEKEAWVRSFKKKNCLCIVYYRRLIFPFGISWNLFSKCTFLLIFIKKLERRTDKRQDR